MSSTNVTEFYGLTQYAGSDKPSFTDNNEAFRAIDAALHGAVSDVADASDAVTALTGRVGDVEEAVTGLSGTVGTQGDAITALQNKEISQDGDIADVKAAALDMICAFNEEAAQSVHAYAIGDFFRYNDVLYKASAVINIGDTIIPNTNCVATNVTEQLLNDVDKVGDLSSLTTTDKSSAVAAINEVSAKVGDLSSLATTDKSSAVAAINEAVADSALTTGTTTDQYVNYIKLGKLVIVSFNLRTATGSATPAWTEVATLPFNVAEAQAAGSSASGNSPLVRVSGTKAYVMTSNTTNEAVSGQVISYTV